MICLYGTDAQKMQVLVHFEEQGGIVELEHETPYQRHSCELQSTRLALLMTNMSEIVLRVGAKNQLQKLSL